MEQSLETLIANLTGGVRRATLNGRQYVVVPVTMIVPGVLPGSAGALYYPPEEVASNVQAWNGIPLTHRHPVVKGSPVSAKTPEVADTVWLGHVFNARYTDKLVAEAWFDVILTNKVDRRIIPALEAGRVIEVSTGLFLQTADAAEGAAYNGRAYQKVTRNYKPDHLAVLMDEEGACSVRDGCGLNVNSSQSTGDSQMKDQLVTWLVANCSCWKGQNATTALNAMTEAELQVLKTNAEAASDQSKQLQAIANSLSAGFVINGVKVALGADGQFKAETVIPAAPVKPIELTPVGQQIQNRSQTFLELLEQTGTPEEKATWNMAVELNRQEKAGLIERLTVNINDATQKAQAVATYSKMDVKDLRVIAPPTQTVANANNAPDFSLGAGGPLVNQNGTSGKNLAINKVATKPVMKITFENPLEAYKARKN